MKSLGSQSQTLSRLAHTQNTAPVPDVTARSRDDVAVVCKPKPYGTVGDPYADGVHAPGMILQTKGLRSSPLCDECDSATASCTDWLGPTFNNPPLYHHSQPCPASQTFQALDATIVLLIGAVKRCARPSRRSSKLPQIHFQRSLTTVSPYSGIFYL